jgi:hypothetical protein
MAVWQRTHDCFGGDSCASTRPVVDYYRLAKSLRQQGAYQPRHSVWGSASSIANHKAYWARWIGLRPCNERRERQGGGSARSQMQNLPSVGKFHGDEPLYSQNKGGAAGAAAIADDDRLTERIGELGADDARHQVGGAARRHPSESESLIELGRGRAGSGRSMPIRLRARKAAQQKNGSPLFPGFGRTPRKHLDRWQIGRPKQSSHFLDLLPQATSPHCFRPADISRPAR